MSAIVRILSHANNKPYRSKDLRTESPPSLDRDGYVEFAPDDVENPRNWSMGRRVVITMSAILLVVNATFASSSPSGCFQSISEHFGVSTEVAGLTITLFLLGYCAGPLIFAPLSEFYGRRWIFYISFSLYLIFNFLCAFAPNLGALLVGRFLTGTFVSAPLSNCPGVVADLWNPLQRANAMAGFSAMVYMGPALGPVVAGFLELKEDWRWSFYVLLWLGGVTALIMLTIPETYAPTILYHKARRVRQAQIPGYEDVKAPIEANGKTLVEIYKVALTRPWIILFDPISLLCAIYMAIVYTLLYMLFSIYPIVFQEKRGWNSGVGELPLIGTVVGALIGGSIVLVDTHLRQRKVERGEKRLEDSVPEDRLPLAMIGGIGFSATMFWFAWSAEFKSVMPFLLPCSRILTLYSQLCPLDRPNPRWVLSLERVAPYLCRIPELLGRRVSDVCSLRHRCQHHRPLRLWCCSTPFHKSNVLCYGRRGRRKLDWRSGCFDGGHPLPFLQIWKANPDSKQIRTDSTTAGENRRGNWSARRTSPNLGLAFLGRGN